MKANQTTVNPNTEVFTYVVRDCHGNVRGNPKGYRTSRGVEQALRQGGKLYRELWETYYAKLDAGPNIDNHFVYEWKLEAVGKF